MKTTIAEYYGASLAADAAESLAWLLSRVGSPVLNEFVPITGDGFDQRGLRIVRGGQKACNQAEIVTPYDGNWALAINGRWYVYTAAGGASAATIAAGLVTLAVAGEAAYNEVTVEQASAIINCIATRAGTHGNYYTLSLTPPAAGGVGGTPDFYFMVGADEAGVLQCKIAPPAAPALDFSSYAQTVREAIDIDGGQIKLYEGGPYPGTTPVSGTAYGLSAGSAYTIKVYSITDALYQQGATITVPGGTSGSYGWSGVSAIGPLIVAKLFKDTVEVAHTQQGVGQKLTDYAAKTWLVTDLPYVQETDIPVVVTGLRAAVVGGLTPMAYTDTPMVTVLNTAATPDKTVYTTRAPEPTYGGMVRSSTVPPLDPYYRDVEEVLTASDAVMQNRSWTYDNALAIFAFVAGGHITEALGIVDALNRLIDLRVYMPEVAYFDGEDAATTNWTLQSGAGTIANIFDSAKGQGGSRVIRLNTGSAGVFRYAMTANTTDKWIEVSINSSTTPFELRFDITSSGGTTQIKFTNGTAAPSKAAGVITYPIGAVAAWRRVQYDLDAILKQFDGGDGLTQITRMEVNLTGAGNFDLDDFTAGDRQPDGSLSFSYDIYFGHVDYPYLRAGAIAWVALAYEYLREEAPEYAAVIDPYLTRILDFLVTLQSADAAPDPRHDLIQIGYGSYYNPGYGYAVGLVPGVSVEHNVDCYFALVKGARILSDATYATTAAEIQAALLAQLWIAPTASVAGHFANGADGSGLDTTQALDSAGSWAAMWCHEIGDLWREAECLKFVYDTFTLSATMVTVPAYDTTINEAITANPAADQWVTPASMNGMVDRGWLVVDTGTDQEGVEIHDISESQVKATFLKNHAGGSAAHIETRMNLVYSQASAMTGYKPYAGGYPGAPAGVWAEGTWGGIEAWLRAAENTDIVTRVPAAETHIQALVDGQKTLRAATPNDGDGGFIAITQAHRNLPYEFGVFRSVASTAWAVMTKLAAHVLLSDGGHPYPTSTYRIQRLGRGFNRRVPVPTISDPGPHAYFGEAMFGDERFGE